MLSVLVSLPSVVDAQIVSRVHAAQSDGRGNISWHSSCMRLLHPSSQADGFYRPPANSMPSRGHIGCNKHGGFTGASGDHIPSCCQSPARQLLRRCQPSFPLYLAPGNCDCRAHIRDTFTVEMLVTAANLRSVAVPATEVSAAGFCSGGWDACQPSRGASSMGRAYQAAAPFDDHASCAQKAHASSCCPGSCPFGVGIYFFCAANNLHTIACRGGGTISTPRLRLGRGR